MPTSVSRSFGMPRPRVTFSRKGTTSSGPSGPPKDSSSSASYGAGSVGVRVSGMVPILPPVTARPVQGFRWRVSGISRVRTMDHGS